MKMIPLALIVLYSFSALGQKTNADIPAYGQIDKADLEMKSCDFDKNAEAVVLFDMIKVTCNVYAYSADTRIERHVRIKILNDKGLNQANIEIPYIRYENMQSVKQIEAQTYNLDGAGNIVVTKLEKKSIYSKDIEKKTVSEKLFTFPEVRAGSVIEYSYDIKGPIQAVLTQWKFQGSVPVRLSRYILECPADMNIDCHPVCILPFKSEKLTKGGTTIQSYTMTNIPALRDEPFISCSADYLQRLEPHLKGLKGTFVVNLNQTWGGIVNSLLFSKSFGKQLFKKVARPADLDTVLKNLADPYLKMCAVYRYVRNRMEWDKVSDIRAYNLDTVWARKKGSTGDINILLINFLRDAGLDVYAVLVSTIENGRIDFDYPDEDTFNKVMAYIRLDGKVYILDATDKNGSPRLIPREVMFTHGLTVEVGDSAAVWKWEPIWDRGEKFKDVAVIEGAVNEKGELSGTASIRSYDYSRAERLPQLKEKRDKFVEKYLSPEGSGIRIDSFQTADEDNDTLPLTQSFQFARSLNPSGGYSYLSTNLFTDLRKNPFTADSRFSDVFFGVNREYDLLCNFDIPAGFSFEDLPRDLLMRLPDTSIVFTRQYQRMENSLHVNISLQINKPLFTNEEYDNFREFYKKLFDLLNEPVIIRKNESATTQKTNS